MGRLILEINDADGPRRKFVVEDGVTIGRGPDNTIVLGDTRSWLDGVVVATFALMALAWIRIAGALVEHPRFGEPLRGFARFGLPILLICVGLYILLDSPTDAIVTS